MAYPLTRQLIAQLCGQDNLQQGESFRRDGSVSFSNADREGGYYKALVKGGGSRYSVSLLTGDNDGVTANCTCPSYYSQTVFCKHIAAALLEVLDAERARPAVRGSLLYPDKKPELGLPETIIDLFGRKPPLRTSGSRFDARTELTVEYGLFTVPFGLRGYLLAVDLKVGPGRPYIVQQLKAFLQAVESGTRLELTKSFAYDPEMHRFSPGDEAAIRELIAIAGSERIYRPEASAGTSKAASETARKLLVPPARADMLLPLLLRLSSVRLEHNGRTTANPSFSDEALPLRFDFDQPDDAETPGAYRMTVIGLERLTVFEAYRLILWDGKLMRADREQCEQIDSLQRMFEPLLRQEAELTFEQMETFVDKVLPGLMKLGAVRLSEPVSDRLVRTPLRAKLYLDRVRDRLLASLEFQYGDLTINPLETAGGMSRKNKDRILVREGDKERQIISFMEQSGFIQTESGYITAEEETEFGFLHDLLPELEKLLTVYATTAVKIRLHRGSPPPQIKVAPWEERMEWLAFTFSLEGIPEAEIKGVVQALEEKRRYYRLRSGALLPLTDEEFRKMVRFMNETGLHSAHLHSTGWRVPLMQGAAMLDAMPDRSALKIDKPVRLLLDHLQNPDHLDDPVPASLSPVLRSYQKDGYRWMRMLARYRFGGILADEMGLGKTVQSIAFLLSMLPDMREQELPSLIVAPASLVYNWRNELLKFAPELRTAIADGSPAERGRLLRRQPDGPDIIITSYPLLRQDRELYGKLEFHTLIIDEAQYMKNDYTQTALSVRKVKAGYKFALSGTPVENSLDELWSICSVVVPSLFPDKRAFGELPKESVARRIRPFLLRRRKADVLGELPEKIETMQSSALYPEQKKLYASYLAKLRYETLKHLDNRTFGRNRISFLAGLTRLRQLCLHPALFVEDYDGRSAKLDQLLEITEECLQAGRRLLIFSQFTEMLELIRAELAARGISCFYLDGQTPARERVELCERFNDGEKETFLISLKAGGTGLNLTGADTVVLYDLWWNPAVEQQAISRAHRMGQRRSVQVIRMVAEGTIEQKMYELQQQKLSLFEEMLDSHDDQPSSLTEQEIQELLQMSE
ncbi:SNF2 helicase associated domain-containing protein [Paenibacillus sp. NPDC058071]|uniref:DEAD/DEAH box helicase n=1 Tax=Paenibacillus sp. NPDC058071 TaxID=3346326 RepID=UPI0036DBEF7D